MADALKAISGALAMLQRDWPETAPKLEAMVDEAIREAVAAEREACAADCRALLHDIEKEDGGRTTVRDALTSAEIRIRARSTNAEYIAKQRPNEEAEPTACVRGYPRPSEECRCRWCCDGLRARGQR